MPLNRQSGITRPKGSSYVPEAVTMAQALELAGEAYRAKQEGRRGSASGAGALRGDLRGVP